VADTVALQALQAIKTRLDAISTGSGYNTDPTVIMGVQPINPDQLNSGPVVTVFELRDDPTDELQLTGAQVIDLTIVVEGQMQFGATSTPQALSELWQDISQAVFLDDTTLGGLVLAVNRGPREFEYPQPGGNTIAVRQAVNVRYLETYGNP